MTPERAEELARHFESDELNYAADAIQEYLPLMRQNADYAKQIEDVVDACLTSREIAPGLQAAYLRDVILTRVDPVMNITARIRARRLSEDE